MIEGRQEALQVKEKRVKEQLELVNRKLDELTEQANAVMGTP